LEKSPNPVFDACFIPFTNMCIGKDFKVMMNVGIEGPGAVVAGMPWSLPSKLPIVKEPLAFAK
jgi:hypothetical protein